MGRSGDSRRVAERGQSLIAYSFLPTPAKRASFVPALTLTRRPSSPGALACVPALTTKVSACSHSSHPVSCWRRSPLWGGLSRAQATLSSSPPGTLQPSQALLTCVCRHRGQRGHCRASATVVVGQRLPPTGKRDATRPNQQTSARARERVPAVRCRYRTTAHAAWSHTQISAARETALDRGGTIQKTIKFGAVPPARRAA